MTDMSKACRINLLDLHTAYMNMNGFYMTLPSHVIVPWIR